jgi:hypothetical protein
MQRVKKFLKFIRESQEVPEWSTTDNKPGIQRPQRIEPEFQSADDELYWYWLSNLEVDDDSEEDDEED